MKLKDLADIFRGLTLDKNWLSSQPEEYNYLTPDQFQGGVAQYISNKNLRKALGQNSMYQRYLLAYGDYLLYEQPNSGLQILRYTSLNKTLTIPSDQIVVLRANSGFLTNYLTFEDNKVDVRHQIQRGRDSHYTLLQSVENVEVSSNILELSAAPPPDYVSIHEPLDMAQVAINIIQKPMTIDSVIQRLQQEPSEINLFTEFQRKAGLWNPSVKSRLIESMIVGLPIPAFYFDVEDDGCWKVVDGIQRLSTLKEFVIDKTLHLEGLEYLSSLEGKSYDELDRREKRNLHEFEIQTYQIKPGTHPGIKYRIFKSINTSALILERQEIRHAVNPGVPAEYLKELADLEIFKKMLMIGDARKDRMEDREQVLRYIAFRNQHYTRYSPDMMDYLDKTMTSIYHINSELRAKYKNEFISALELLRVIFTKNRANVFNKTAFGLSDSDHIHNSSVFEILTVCFSELDTKTQNLIRNYPNEFRLKLEALGKDPEFAKSIEPSNAWTKNAVETRFSILSKLLKDWRDAN